MSWEILNSEIALYTERKRKLEQNAATAEQQAEQPDQTEQQKSEPESAKPKKKIKRSA